jgi:glycosyltransferase involved in cell wall biosynthesis
LAASFNLQLKFSIVTPSFRSSKWLKLCIASVADQQGVEIEHIVQDSCSDDGTQDWLPRDTRVKAFIEKDNGMYDAVNCGYKRASGDILAHLNCDEQYLPGGLKAVHDFFEANPSIEVVLAHSLIVDGQGQYICHRHMLVPHPWHVWHRFRMLTCSLFIRRKVIFERGIFFDTKWRDLGDFHWALELMKNKVPMAECHFFTSVFTDTGENMGWRANAMREKAETNRMIPLPLKALKPLWILHHRLRQVAGGHFRLKPAKYQIYTLDSPERRVTVDVPKPTAVWWDRVGADERMPAPQ